MTLRSLLFLALSLAFSGCSLIPLNHSDDTSSLTDDTNVLNFAEAPKPPEAPRQAQVAPAAPPVPPRMAEPKIPPTSNRKGAEQLLSAPTPTPAPPVQTAMVVAKPAIAAPVAARAPSASATVRELVFKGPPRPVKSSNAGFYTFVWIGLGACVVVVGVVVLKKTPTKPPRKATRRRPDDDDFKLPPELIMREPTGLTRKPLGTLLSK